MDVLYFQRIHLTSHIFCTVNINNYCRMIVGGFHSKLLLTNVSVTHRYSLSVKRLIVNKIED